MKKLIPSKAVRVECRVCNGGKGPCASAACALNRPGSPLQKIKEHCRACAADHRPENCTGKVLGAQAKAYHDLYGKAICPLHPYRLGKNPNMGRALSEDQKKMNVERLQSYRFKKKETLSVAGA